MTNCFILYKYEFCISVIVASIRCLNLHFHKCLAFQLYYYISQLAFAKLVVFNFNFTVMKCLVVLLCHKHQQLLWFFWIMWYFLFKMFVCFISGFHVTQSTRKSALLKYIGIIVVLSFYVPCIFFIDILSKLLYVLLLYIQCHNAWYV